MEKKRSGFTLIELLVTMAIAAILITVALPNYLSARERARDAKLKASMEGLKQSLRLYYNDYQKYPASNTNPQIINGCGSTGTVSCPNGCTTADFSAGGSASCGTSIYMKKLPIATNNGGLKYYQTGNGDSYYACVDKLENATDPDAAASMTRCGQSLTSPVKYCICSD